MGTFVRGKEELAFRIVTQLMAEDAKTAWGVTETVGDFGRGEVIDEVGSKCFGLTVG